MASFSREVIGGMAFHEYCKSRLVGATVMVCRGRSMSRCPFLGDGFLVADRLEG